MIMIDLKQLEKSKLNLNEYIVIKLLHEKEYKDLKDFITITSGKLHSILVDLEAKSLIKIGTTLENAGNDEDIFNNIYLRADVLKWLESNTINFDELFFTYPAFTPDKRALRSVEKQFKGQDTISYTTCKRKYLKTVKNVDLHNTIVNIVKDYISKAGNKLNYLNNLETFINQRGWEVMNGYLSKLEVNDNIGKVRL